MKDLELKIRLTADNSGLTGKVKSTSVEVLANGPGVTTIELRTMAEDGLLTTATVMDTELSNRDAS